MTSQEHLELDLFPGSPYHNSSQEQPGTISHTEFLPNDPPLSSKTTRIMSQTFDISPMTPASVVPIHSFLTAHITTILALANTVERVWLGLRQGEEKFGAKKSALRKKDTVWDTQDESSLFSQSRLMYFYCQFPLAPTSAKTDSETQ
jgi:hypothetical protein